VRIHAVIVVPIFEPMITPMLCLSVMIPEFTSPTSITVTAEDDWMAAVMPSPSKRHLKRFEVIALSARSSFPPAIRSSPEERTSSPNRTDACVAQRSITSVNFLLSLSPLSYSYLLIRYLHTTPSYHTININATYF